MNKESVTSVEDINYEGTFKVRSGKIRVSDPCYDIDSELGAEFPVKNGTWHSGIVLDDLGEFWGTRPSELHIWHSTKKSVPDEYELLSSRIGVDTGTCGFFDKEFYQNDEDFYDEVHATEEYTSLMKGGISCLSGLGDGLYDLFVYKNKTGLVTSAKLIFLPYKFEDGVTTESVS